MTPDLRGSLYMTAAMAGFAVEDALLKQVSRSVPVGEAIALMGVIGMAVFAGFAWRVGDAPLPRGLLSRIMLLRSGFESVGRLFYALAVALTPLSTAAAILQATPLVVVLGAALVFGERVGWRRWGLILLGFAGVLVILRPGMEGFSPLSGLALLATLGFAGRDLATRAAPLTLSTAQLGVTGFAILTLSGVIILSVTGGAVLPDAATGALLLLAALFGISGYAALTVAMRAGALAVVAPFRYTRLLFAMVMGTVFFGERPDVATLVGAALIVVCGVALLGQGRKS